VIKNYIKFLFSLKKVIFFFERKKKSLKSLMKFYFLKEVTNHLCNYFIFNVNIYSHKFSFIINNNNTFLAEYFLFFELHSFIIII